MSNPRSIRGTIALAFATFFMLTPASAQKAKVGPDTLDQLVVSAPGAWVGSDTLDFEIVRGTAPQKVGVTLDEMRVREGGMWTMLYDNVTGQPALIEGSGIPWIPGAGNQLVRAGAGDVGVEAAPLVPRAYMVDKALKMIAAYPALFGAAPEDLTVMEGATGPVLDYLYYVDFQWNYRGIPVEHAHVVFRVNHGNLVQFGQEYVSDAIKALDATPYLTAQNAWQAVHSYASWRGDEEIVEPGKLLVMPVAASGSIAYRLVYVMAFRRPGVMGTWEARIDAHTGEIVQFRDTNAYGHIQGGTYVTDKNPTQTEASKSFPYGDYGTNLYADAAGNYSGTSGTSALSGKYVKIADSCGAISKASDAAGLISFGTSTGTDCTTPGSGGAGNTHSARTQYWNLTQIKIKGLTYLGSNTWLNGKLTANVDLNQTCNAYWNGSTVNFFKSGGGCANTGELPGVSMHEWGHGLDSNDGNGSAPDGASGEAYGDTTAMLQTHQSCIGGGFLGSNCSGYGNPCTNCTGVRDVDYAKHSSQTPATPLGFNQSCPAGSGGTGPCGKEVHCESAPPAQAAWDLANRDLITWGMDVTSAWQLVDKLWYASRPTSTGMFACGNNTSCNAGNLFAVFRVADDCDGNLANGTPHASAIWAAFNRHQIGCSSAVNTDNSCGCANLATPALSGTAGNNSASLSWNAVSGATSYNIYRNEVGCTAGFTKVTSTTATSYTDTGVVNGSTYYYRVQANGSGSCPPSLMSGCVTITPAGGGGTPDFTLAVSPSSVSAVQGGTATATASTTVSGGFNAAIGLTVSGVPSGATGSFSPASIPAPGSGSSTLTLSAGTAAAGTYSLTITGTGGGITHTAGLSFTVTAPGGTYPESAHPYANNTNLTWSYTQSGSPASINVTFDAQTSVETNYDYIYVKDKNGVNIAGSPFTGTTLAGATKNVPGDTVKITLTSDSSVTKWGFKVTNVTAGGGGGPQQLLLNPGFESGAVNWTQTAGVIDNSTGEASHSGSWKAWMNGYGAAHTDSLYQSVTIPANVTTATLSFWLHIDTAESGGTAYDTLKVQIRNTSGTVLATLATYSNANAASGYSQKSFNVAAYKGQTIQVYLLGVEDASLQTSFVTDDYALNVQ
ncbi:MAG: hypothetical protein U0166_22870 [Acidobacteriota bacterium]